MDWLRRSVVSAQVAWAGIPVLHRVITGVLVVLLAFAGVWAFTAPGRDAWVRIVDRERTLEDRSRIVSLLHDQKIPVRVEGETVSVPASRADEAMLQLHSSGVLNDESFFAFLKETDFFATREKTDRQWLLAIQRSLATKIQNLDYVRRAWVQISELADSRSLWWANGKEATAAVLLELEPNQRMTGRRATGIAALVSAARSDIKPSGVRILDQAGQLFAVAESDSGPNHGLLELEFELASKYESKALVVLPPDSKVVVTVRLNAERRKVEQKSEVRSQNSGSGAQEMADGPGESSTRLRTEERLLPAGSELEHISVSALVPDTAAQVPRDAAPRAEYVLQLTRVLRDAIGAEERNITIRIAPPSASLVTGAVGASAAPPESPSRSALPVLVGLALVGAAVVARFSRRTATEETVVAEESLRAPGESILAAQDETLDRIREGVRASVIRNPREAAEVARRWMAP